MIPNPSQEYSANLIIPFANILNAVEIDPMSKTKRFCMQIIAEERNYRFCAPDEENMTKCLGAFKSLLAKRKEVEMQRRAAGEQKTAPAGPANAQGSAPMGQRVVSGPSTTGQRAVNPVW